jgi:hypothetical protein
MSTEEKDVESWVKPRNKGGRPRKYVQRSKVTRETRVPLSGIRDILTVEGKDPNYHYFWALDADEKGNELYKLSRAGYEFVQAESVVVGEASVYKSHDVGSIVRVPNKDGRFLFLMRIPMQWYMEDQAELERKNKEQEQSILAFQQQEGVYGEIKLGKRK